jgi:hypothetical protein
VPGADDDPGLARPQSQPIGCRNLRARAAISAGGPRSTASPATGRPRPPTSNGSRNRRAIAPCRDGAPGRGDRPVRPSLVEVLRRPHAQAGAPASSANAAAANQASGGTTTVQQEDITGVVANVRDSVVTLTSQISTGGGGGRGFFGGGGGGTATGIGTGIVLTADGYVLTNRHVVEGSQSLKATLADGSEYPASVVTTSDTQDLALVKVDATGLKPATIGNSATRSAARRRSPSAARSARSPRRSRGASSPRSTGPSRSRTSRPASPSR